MTDDQLHELWLANASIRDIAIKAKVTRSVIACRVKRLRRQEGVERWPHHHQWKRRTDSVVRTKRIQRGASTLPPLPSQEP